MVILLRVMNGLEVNLGKKDLVVILELLVVQFMQMQSIQIVVNFIIFQDTIVVLVERR